MVHVLNVLKIISQSLVDVYVPQSLNVCNALIQLFVHNANKDIYRTLQPHLKHVLVVVLIIQDKLVSNATQNWILYNYIMKNLKLMMVGVLISLIKNLHS